ncbi:putative allantoate permease protein [Eutypa lata UCREL1]|uniref:Putative allantoate permease protein n=1 Tax=Eutypa lata (strain UCR-EL1) TaxID=1287681 RepID=M7TXS7_EUTLA|nr:putative allantoate permease protein [Eutypa lata UCREL1]
MAQGNNPNSLQKRASTSSSKINPKKSSYAEDNADVEADLKVGSIVDLDEAGLFLQQHGISHTRLAELMADENAVKRLRRKVDWTLMPLLCGTYLLQYVDKQALSYSAVFDLLSSTGMTSDQYSWMASIFYFAYLVAEWPSSYLAQRFPTGRVVSIFVIAWGTILVCTAAAQNFAGLAVTRFLLGTFESVITPAFMLIVSQWFTRDEQPARAGLFYCFNGFGSMFGGILFFGVGQASGWDVWRIIYVLCGGLTICWGILLFFFLPDSILTAKRYTVEERAILIARSARNRTGVFSRTIKANQIKEVFTDSQIWLLFFYVLLNECVNGGIANFSKLIVKGFTNDSLLTTVYGIPYGACTACASFIGGLIVALQMPASNVGGYTKRTTATAFVFLAYCIGNIIGPHAFLGAEAPIYQTGCKLIIGCTAGQVVIAAALRFVLIRRNKLRDAQGDTLRLGPEEEVGLQDLTDFENPEFRYSY